MRSDCPSSPTQRHLQEISNALALAIVDAASDVDFHDAHGTPIAANAEILLQGHVVKQEVSDFALFGRGESSDDTDISSAHDDLKIMPAAPGLPDKESDGQ